MKGNRYPNVDDFFDRQVGMKPLVIDWVKEEGKLARIIIFVFLANSSIFKSII